MLILKNKGGKMKETKKEVYETPKMEVVEFELEDSIATSGNFGSNTLCGGEFGL